MTERFRNPAAMAPTERRQEIAHILATGYLRLCKSSQVSLADRAPDEPSCEPVNTHETREEVA